MLTRRKACWWFKVHGSSHQRAGVPDIIVCYRGQFVGLEVKRPAAAGGRASGSRVTPIQRYEIGKIEQAEGIARIVTSAEEAEELLNGIDVMHA